MATIRRDPETTFNSECQSICNCGYRTKRLSNLSRHIKTMHGIDSNKDFTCCGTVYPTKATYKDHRLEVHTNGYECPECLKVFSRRALLYRHSSVHTGVRDFHCHLCDYESSHKSNLERHIQTRHRNPAKVNKAYTTRHYRFKGPTVAVPDSTSTGSPHLLSQRPTINHSIVSILTRPMKSKKNVPEIVTNNEVSSTTTTTTALPGYPGTWWINFKPQSQQEHVPTEARSDFPENKPHHDFTLKDIHMGQDLRFHTATTTNYYALTLNHTGNLFTPYYYGYYDNNVGQQQQQARHS